MAQIAECGFRWTVVLETEPMEVSGFLILTGSIGKSDISGPSHLGSSVRRTHGRRCVQARHPVSGIVAAFADVYRMEAIRATSLRFLASSVPRILGSSNPRLPSLIFPSFSRNTFPR
jgi:hypothetical protein